MTPLLSIIIPCYNSEETLVEAIDSCYTQKVSNFEIILVDDGSTDNTREIIKNIAAAHKNIRYIFHDQNMGGGASRNTAVAHAAADIIFCLDSDDILPAGTLEKMLAYIKEKKCDAVGIHRSIKFKGTNVQNIEIVHQFGYADQKIPFESLFQKNDIYCSLYSTFMFTKKSFMMVGGYPTYHGFDTQGIAWRYLARGFSAYTCPDTEYLHRVQFHRSYYIREYENGLVNENWRLILSEFLFLFNEDQQKYITEFNPNSEHLLIEQIKKAHSPLTSNYKEMLTYDYLEKVMSENQTTTMKPSYLYYAIAANSVAQQKFNQAFIYYSKALDAGVNSRNGHRDQMMALLLKEKKTPQEIYAILSKKFPLRKYGKAASYLARLRRKIKKWYHAITNKFVKND